MLASTWDWPVVPWHRQNFDQYPNGYGSKGVPTDPWNRSSWAILSMTPSNFGLNSGRTIAILICGYSQSLDPSWSVLWGSIFLHKLENPIHVLFSINVSVYTHPIPSRSISGCPAPLPLRPRSLPQMMSFSACPERPPFSPSSSRREKGGHVWKGRLLRCEKKCSKCSYFMEELSNNLVI